MKFGNTARKRGRPRKVDIMDADVTRTVQDVSFPVDETTAIAAEDTLRTDAENKRRVAAAAKEIPEIFTPEDVEWVFDVYVAILCFVYSIALKCEMQVIKDELSFDKDEKETMAKPLAKICSKYAPAEWAGKSAEIQLIISLGVWTVTSFKRAQNAAKKAEEKRRDAERTQPIDRMRRAGEPLVPA